MPVYILVGYKLALWNNLPEHLENIDSIVKFQIALKTHLFNI